MAVYFCELCNVNHAVGSGCPKDIPYCDVCHQPTNQAPTTFEEPTKFAFSTTFINSMILVLSGAAVVLGLLIYFK